MVVVTAFSVALGIWAADLPTSELRVLAKQVALPAGAEENWDAIGTYSLKGKKAGLGEQSQRPDNQTKKIILQYLVAWDTALGSGFGLVQVGPIGMFQVGPIGIWRIKWDLPSDQLKEKLAFDNLIRDLEKKGINSVEFECQAEELSTGELRVTTVPQLTSKGRERIKEREH